MAVLSEGERRALKIHTELDEAWKKQFQRGGIYDGPPSPDFRIIAKLLYKART